MCPGAAWSQCRFWHCWSSDHVTGAARSILCKGYGSEVVRVISQWSNTDLPGQGSTISPSHSRLQCATGIGIGTSEIHCLHRRSGKPHRRPSSGSSHVCGRHSTYRIYNGFWHSECHHETAKLCRIHSRVVQIQETAIKSGENRTDLVRIKSQFEENCSSWSELVYWSWHHKAGWCCPRSRGLLRQWTKHGSACKDRRPQLFLPSPTSQIRPAHPRRRSYTRPGVSFRDNQAWLL